jgi:hypothetical protein
VTDPTPIPSPSNDQLEQLKQLRMKAIQQAQLREEIAERLNMLDTYDEGILRTTTGHYYITL